MSSSKPPPTFTKATSGPDSGDSEEEDYMKMTFTNPPAAAAAGKETSLQRRQRERREAELRSRPKSKAELAAEEEARREAAQSRSLFSTASLPSSSAGDAKKSKGLAMMAKMGFKGGALGKKRGEKEEEDDRVTEPIRAEIRDGREGIGLESERKRKMREAAERIGEAAKKSRVDEGEYRERVRREREEARLERMVLGAQKIAERMDGGEEGIVRVASTPLRSVPVLYRGLVRGRERAERDARMRRELELSSSSLSRKLPGYDDEDEDEDDKRALGKTEDSSSRYVTADDLDEEDDELDEFDVLPPDERLRRLVLHLRIEHRYCFWCKYAYPDAEMDGCPGLTEEDHD